MPVQGMQGIETEVPSRQERLGYARLYGALLNDFATLWARKNACQTLESLKRRMDTGARDRNRTGTPPLG